LKAKEEPSCPFRHDLTFRVCLVQIQSDIVRVRYDLVCVRILDDGQGVVGIAVFTLVGWLGADLETEGFDVGVLNPYRFV
jgi:hypothetical protein